MVWRNIAPPHYHLHNDSESRGGGVLSVPVVVFPAAARGRDGVGGGGSGQEAQMCERAEDRYSLPQGLGIYNRLSRW